MPGRPKRGAAGRQRHGLRLVFARWGSRVQALAARRRSQPGQCRRGARRDAARRASTSPPASKARPASRTWPRSPPSLPRRGRQRKSLDRGSRAARPKPSTSGMQMRPQSPNSFRTGPDERGHFGIFGGRFVAETLMPLILDLERHYEAAKHDPAFKAELDHLLTHYVGRPSPLYFAERLTAYAREKAGDGARGAKIYFKREELNHTGAHKINNVLGQILLARRMGKSAHHRRDRRRPAWRCDRDRLRALRPRMHRLYGRRRCRAAEAECLPHEHARRESRARAVRRAHAEGCDERGVARLGHQCRRYILLHRHGGRAASLSGDGARFPMHHRRGDAHADARGGRPAAGFALRLYRRRLERDRPLPSLPR